MSHSHFQFRTSLTCSNGHQLGQWFPARGNFASQARDVAKYPPMHSRALTTMNYLVQHVNVGEIEKSQVRPSEISGHGKS